MADVHLTRELSEVVFGEDFVSMGVLIFQRSIECFDRFHCVSLRAFEMSSRNNRGASNDDIFWVALRLNQPYYSTSVSWYDDRASTFHAKGWM